MTRRLPVAPSPGPLEHYATRFDDLFGARAQREGFRRYLEGLLLPAERNKTLTALANTEPVAGAQRKEAQSLQWFLSESGWEQQEFNERRLELLLEDRSTAANEEGVLVIDEHGDRKWGKKTAHVGRQWLANIGKTENGVVSVSSLWADEGVYWPVDFEPYTPAHHFRSGKNDPAFRTKLKMASELVEKAVGRGIPFRAVVADSFYGEDRAFKRSLKELGVVYVLSLKKSHSWWHAPGTIGALWEAALVASGWEGAEETGGWEKVARRFRDGHREDWWALEVEAGPYGKERAKRAIVVTTDPKGLPDLATWYLTTNLPAPSDRSERAAESDLAPASVAEVVRLYGLRMWVERSYKQVATSRSSTSWAGAATRPGATRPSDAIGIWCAWRSRPAGGRTGACRLHRKSRRKNVRRKTYAPGRPGGAKGGHRASWPEALRAVRGWLEPWVMLWRYWRAFSDLPPPQELRMLLDLVFSGRGPYLYVR